MSDKIWSKHFGQESSPGTPAKVWEYTSPTRNEVRCAVCRALVEGVSMTFSPQGNSYVLACGHHEGVVTIIPAPNDIDNDV